MRFAEDMRKTSMGPSITYLFFQTQHIQLKWDELMLQIDAILHASGKGAPCENVPKLGPSHYSCYP